MGRRELLGGYFVVLSESELKGAFLGIQCIHILCAVYCLGKEGKWERKGIFNSLSVDGGCCEFCAFEFIHLSDILLFLFMVLRGGQD